MVSRVPPSVVLFLDSIFEPCQQPALQEELMNWCPKEKTYETDLAVLQWVEELEQRVILSDLQIRVHGDGHCGRPAPGRTLIPAPICRTLAFCRPEKPPACGSSGPLFCSAL